MKNRSKRPPLHLLASEAELIANLAVEIEDQNSSVAALLLEEIERARLHVDGRLPKNVVSMNSTVTFVDERSEQRRTVQVVYPREADIAAGRISILTPVGAGLIGVTEGKTISWPDREGRERPLRIESVVQPGP